MNSILRTTLFAAAFTAAVASSSAAEPGYVDFGEFTATAGRQFVEVNLHAPILKFASAFVAKEEPDVAALIRGLKRVRVNVIGYDETTRQSTVDRALALRSELEAQGWTRMVDVQHGGEGEDVGVYAKLAADDSIEGVVVTVLNARDNQAVFVNVVGNISPDQLARLGEGLHLEPLAQLRAKKPAPRS